jgi:hypothetical protein
MNNHLSSEQISSWMIGERSPEAQKHAGMCPECRAELDRLQDALSSFRSSVLQWVDVQTPALNTARGLRSHSLHWVLATATVVLLAVILIYKNISDRQREAEAVQDALLLEEVNVHLSRGVPAALEPFMELMSVKTGSIDQKKNGELR